MLLTKTNYLQYLACPKEFWMGRHQPELLPPFSEEAKFKVEQGNRIDQLAQKWFVQAYGKDQEVVFQQQMEWDQFLVIADIVVITGPNRCKIYEVKASTEVKLDHIHDVAFQQMVYEGAGWTVEETWLVHVNKHYRTRSTFQLEGLLEMENIGDRVMEVLTDTKRRARQALAYWHKEQLDLKISISCASKKGTCPYIQTYFPDFPTYSVFNIARINKTKLNGLLEEGIYAIEEVPDHLKLSPKQRAQVDLAQKKEVVINKKAIKKILGELSYPLYFLDYETYSYVIPPQEGLKPYQQMVFQYSLHSIAHQGAEVQHEEFILTTQQQSVEELILSLRKHISPSEGTVMVWNDKFEKPRNEEMAELYPQHASFLYAVNDRVYDLMKIFQDGYYQHHAFQGSASIKKVLPVLCPELSYQELAIQNGGHAVIQWHKATTGQLPKAEIQKDLLAYCCLDTLAMVKIWEVLQRL